MRRRGEPGQLSSSVPVRPAGVCGEQADHRPYRTHDDSLPGHLGDEHDGVAGWDGAQSAGRGRQGDRASVVDAVYTADGSDDHNRVADCVEVQLPARFPAQCPEQEACVESPGTIDPRGPQEDCARVVNAGRARCGQRRQGGWRWRRAARGDVGQQGRDQPLRDAIWLRWAGAHRASPVRRVAAGSRSAGSRIGLVSGVRPRAPRGRWDHTEVVRFHRDWCPRGDLNPHAR